MADGDDLVGLVLHQGARLGQLHAWLLPESPPDHLNAEDNLSSLLSISCSAKIGCGDAGDRSITDVAVE